MCKEFESSLGTPHAWAPHIHGHPTSMGTSVPICMLLSSESIHYYPSSVTTTWGEVPCVEQNSVVVGYSFLYGPVTSGVRGTVATSVRAMTVTGLAPYTNYSIVVLILKVTSDDCNFNSRGDPDHFNLIILTLQVTLMIILT